ncbi:MAG TPA: DUF4403 family protein [Rhizomicrobium sp.]|jgi:hypothetical protein
MEMLGAREGAKCLATFGFVAAFVTPFSASRADTVPSLTQAPPRVAATMQFEAQTSTIAPTVEVPYNVVEQAANAAADRFAGPRAGKTRIGCQNVGFGGSTPVKVTLFHGCADFNWHVTAARNGNITVKRADNGITMDVPVKFTGTGSFEGDLARAIRTSNQNFSGTFVVSISGNVAIDNQFVPKVEGAKAHFAWGTAPDMDIIGRSCLDVGHGLHACIGPWKFPAGAMMTDQINHQLQQQVDEINSKIPRDAIRGPLQQVWKIWSIPVPVTNPPAYITIQPKDLSVSDITATDNGIKMSARLDAMTGVSATPQQQKPLPLPDNTPVTAQASRFSVALPVPVPYPLLAAAGAGGIVGKAIRSAKTRVTPTEIAIYPVHDQLAVGVTLRDDTPGKLRGKTGTVWFTATPTVDNNGHAIRLGNLTTTRSIDSPLWHAVSAAVDPLKQKVATTYSYDFSGLLQQAKSNLDRALADPKNTAGLKIGVTNEDLKLGRTANLPGNFVIEGLFNADVGIALPNAGAQSSNSQATKTL